MGNAVDALRQMPDAATQHGSAPFGVIQLESAAPALDSMSTILEGATVVIKGLSKKSINGEIGILTKFIEDSGRYAIQLSHKGETKVFALKAKHVSILTLYRQEKFDQEFWRKALEVGGSLFALNYPFPPKDAIVDWLKTEEAQYFLDDFYPQDANEILYEHEIVEKWYSRLSETFRARDKLVLDFTIQQDIKAQLLKKVGYRGLVQNLRIVEGLGSSDAFFASRIASDCAPVYHAMVGVEDLWFEDVEGHLDSFVHNNWVAHHPYPARNIVWAWLESFDASDYSQCILRDNAHYYDHDGVRQIYETGERSVAEVVARRIFNNGGAQAMKANFCVLSAICKLRIPAFFGKQAKRGPRLIYLPFRCDRWWKGIGGWTPQRDFLDWL